MEDRNDVGHTLSAACAALKLKSSSSKVGPSLKVADVERLAEAIGVAKQVCSSFPPSYCVPVQTNPVPILQFIQRGLNADSHQVQNAVELEHRVREQIKIQMRLEEGLRLRDNVKLKVILLLLLWTLAMFASRLIPYLYYQVRLGGCGSGASG